MKKEDKKKVYMGIFVAFLMISSTVGFMYGGSGETKTINDYKFKNTGNGWSVYIKELNQDFLFNYLPSEIDFDVNMGGEIGGVVYLVGDMSDLYYYEFSNRFALLGVLVTRLDEGDLDCSSESINFVFSGEGYNKIYKEENCVYLEGNNEIKLMDGLFYKILGVI